MSKNIKLSTMVGENFEIFFCEMSKIAFKLSTMVGENFEDFMPNLCHIS